MSPLYAFLPRVNKLFYSLSGSGGREGGKEGGGREGGGEGAVGTRRESGRERERGEVSIQECAWASLGLTQPR